MTYTDQYYVTYRARGIFYTLNGFDSNTNLTINYLGDQGFGLAPLHRRTYSASHHETHHRTGPLDHPQLAPRHSGRARGDLAERAG